MNAVRFTELYEPLYKDLYRFILYTMGNSHDAEDAMSESVLAAWEKRGQLKKESSFKSWLFQIAANVCRSHLKKSARLLPSEHEDLEPSDTPRQMDVSDAFAVRDLFSKLKDEDRLIVALSVFGGYRSEDIASALSMNANTVRSRRKRALDWMAAQWEGK